MITTVKNVEDQNLVIPLDEFVRFTALLKMKKKEKKKKEKKEIE